MSPKRWRPLSGDAASIYISYAAKNAHHTQQKIPNFFADTCWYAMTKRMKEEMFESYIQKRKKQGFTAIQISIGIPPEVNTKNKDAESEKGIAWEENGKIN